mgnify:CR=1 FL=1
MKVALYARVSTRDKDQSTASQLFTLRGYCQTHNYEVAAVYEDQASALDMRARTGWRQMITDSYNSRNWDAIVVTKLDRAFRSSKDTHDYLAQFEQRGIGFICSTQPFDTTSAVGKLQVALVAAFAEFERNLISERTLEGLARVKAEGKRLGRPVGAKDSRKRRQRVPGVRWARGGDPRAEVGPQ